MRPSPHTSRLPTGGQGAHVHRCISSVKAPPPDSPAVRLLYRVFGSERGHRSLHASCGVRACRAASSPHGESKWPESAP